MLKDQLKSLKMVATKSTGADDADKEADAQTAADESVQEMVKPSIFDTEEMKRVKGIMTEVQEYIAEIEYTKANKQVLEKEREEAKKQRDEKSSAVPEGFGKPQPNADQFKTVTFTVKKKRTYQEMQASHQDQAKKDESQVKDPMESKRLKTSD